MLKDSYTEVTSESWFGRIGGAFKGIIIGIILFIIAFPVLFFNEGRAVKTYKMLDEGLHQVISVDSQTVDSANNGKLVHLTGEATTQETLSDATFNVSANAIKLARTVQMYQWKESKETTTQKKTGGSKETVTTYNYSKTWSDRQIDSNDFKKPDHVNPQSMAYTSSTQSAKNVKLGGFDLSNSLINKISDYQNYPLESSTAIPQGISGNVAVHNGGFYIGANPSSPEIGDLKISFRVAPSQTVSVVSQQADNTFEPYTSKVGKKLEMLEAGTFSAEAMFQKAQDENAMLTWILRFVGFFLMFIGIVLILRPLSVLADVLPFLGNLIGAATGLVAFLIAAIVSLLVIALSWIIFRPLLGIALIAVVGVLIYLLKTMAKGKRVS